MLSRCVTGTHMHLIGGCAIFTLKFFPFRLFRSISFFLYFYSRFILKYFFSFYSDYFSDTPFFLSSCFLFLLYPLVYSFFNLSPFSPHSRPLSDHSLFLLVPSHTLKLFFLPYLFLLSFFLLTLSITHFPSFVIYDIVLDNITFYLTSAINIVNIIKV